MVSEVIVFSSCRRRTHAGTDLETSSLLSSVPSAVSAVHGPGKEITSLTYLGTLRVTLETRLTRYAHWCNRGTNTTE